MRTKHPLRLGLDDHDLKLARCEFAEAQLEEPWRYERVCGRLFVMPPPTDDHQRIRNRIRSYLGAYELAHPDVVDCVFSEAWVTTNTKTDRIVDIGVYLRSDCSIEVGPQRPPDIAFQIFTGGVEDRKRDYVDKRREFHLVGVREYVLVDRFRRKAIVLRWSRGQYDETHFYPIESYRSPLLPELRIPLAEVI